MTRIKPIVITTLIFLLPMPLLGQMEFVVADPADGHPILINGGLGGMDGDGMEPAILVTRGMVSDIYITPGIVKLMARSFLKDGVYSVKLFSHYHHDEFCKYSAEDQLKPEFVPHCRSIGYRSCDFTVDTHQRKFRFGSPWPCLFLSVDGTPLMGISKSGFLPSGWVSFDSIAKTKDSEFLKIIEATTATVKKITDWAN